MGLLTTVTLYNDGLHLIDPSKPENQDSINQMAQGIIDGARGKGGSVAIGNFGNMLNVQQSRHASDFTIYVHFGNTVSEFNAHSGKTMQMMKDHPKYAKEVVKDLERQVKQLKAMIKENEFIASEQAKG